jgi:hypothetical protein
MNESALPQPIEATLTEFVDAAKAALGPRSATLGLLELAQALHARALAL